MAGVPDSATTNPSADSGSSSGPFGPRCSMLKRTAGGGRSGSRSWWKGAGSRRTPASRRAGIPSADPSRAGPARTSPRLHGERSQNPARVQCGLFGRAGRAGSGGQGAISHMLTTAPPSSRHRMWALLSIAPRKAWSQANPGQDPPALWESCSQRSGPSVPRVDIEPALAP
jgi:hypothetical protein